MPHVFLTTVAVLVAAAADLVPAPGGPAVGDEAASSAPDHRLEVLYHADLDGRLAAPRCGKPGPEPPSFAALVGTIARARAKAAAEGRVAPVVLLGGNQAAPALFARTLREQDALGGLLARAGYDAVALGHHELSLEGDGLEAFVGALSRRGLPVVATNLRCTRPGRRVCALVRTDLVVVRGDTKVGVLAVISPEVAVGIASGRLDGLAIDDPVAAIEAGVRRLRARGATTVLVMAQGPRAARALDHVEALLRRLGADRRASPDVIFAGGVIDEEGGRALSLLRRAGAPPVVGSPGAGSGLAHVMLPPDPVAGLAVDTLAAAAAGVDIDVDADTAAALRAPVTAFCAKYGAAVVPRPHTSGATLTREQFTRYVLEVMRREAGAEIAFLNRGAVRRLPFPLNGALTQADLHDALPYSAVIGVARATGPNVESVLGPALANPKAVTVGLARAAGGLEVNGRKLDKARAYRVATIAFVTSGGDALVPVGALSWSPLPGEPDLRAAVERTLRAEGTSGVTDKGKDGATFTLGGAFGPPPGERLLLVGLTDIGLDLTDTAIHNTPGYGDAQLSRSRQTSVKGDATVILQMRLPRHEEDTRLNLRYGWARNRPAGAPSTAAVSGETVDLVTFTSVYTYRGLRDLRVVPRIAVPDPYARVWVESEVTRPAIAATQTRDFHHLQAQATAGALFTLFPQLKLRGGGGARRELLASGTAGKWQPVLEAGATLDPTALATFGPLAIRLEGLISYDFIDPGGVREQQLRGAAKLGVPLLPLLFVTAGLDVFAVEREQRGWGASYDTTLGLRLHLDTAHQRL